MERFEDNCLVSGFFLLPARALLKFLCKWRLNALVQLENQRVQVVLSAGPFCVEADAALRGTQINYESYNAKETKILKDIVTQFGELPVEQLSVVAMPRVFHLQLQPKFGLSNDLITDVCNHKDVVDMRFGGVKSCVEVIIKRPKKDSMRPTNTINVRTKNLRRVRLSAKTQVITPHAVKLNV